MAKKIFVCLLIMTIIISSFASCSSGSEITIPAHAEGSIFAGKNDDSVPLTVRFGTDWLTKADNTKYSKDLAAFAALLSTDSYFREKDLAKNTQNRIIPDGTASEDYTFTTLLSALGFTETRHIESFKEKTYEEDTNDSVTMNLGHCVADGCNIYVAVIRGCFSAGEWVSAFDVGSADETYEAVTGKHPDWLNKSNLKGVDVAANRAIGFIDAFIKENGDSSKPNRILITGHSRGGAIAEIVGSVFEDRDDFTSYTYAFNSLAVSYDGKAQNYRSIFNIFDSRDLFSDFLPFGQDSRYYYGQVLEKAPETITAEINALTGHNDYCVSSGEINNEYSSTFGRRFPSRDALYGMRTVSEEYGKAEAEEKLQELNAIISSETGLGLENYCSVELADAGEKATVTMTFCDAAALQAIGKVYTYGQTAADAVKILFRKDDDVCAIADFLLRYKAEMSGGHLLINSYILTQSF